MRVLFACIALAALALHGDADLVNVEVQREVDIRSNVEIEKTVVTMRNDGAAPEVAFILVLPARGLVGTLIAAAGKVVKGDGSRSLALAAIENGRYRVALEAPLPPGESTTVTLLVDYLQTLRASPAEIRAGEEQTVAYAGDAYWHTPYATEVCRTVVALPAARPAGVSDLPSPSAIRSYQLTLGPYKGLVAGASREYRLRVLNNRGFLVADSATLWYHVSHWGRVAVREEFRIRNAAAALRGEWSRADYDRNAGRVDPTSHGDVWANLPPDADGVQYEDLIGNITTSRLRQPTAKQRSIMLTFRFPMLGGWRNHFWYRYYIKLSNHLRSASTQHQLTLPALPSLHYNLPIEKHQLRISLPVGTTDIEVDAHPTLRFAVERETESSTLSVLGRPTVVLTHANVRSGAPHKGEVMIRYKFARHMLLLAPAYIITLLAGFFSVALLAARITVQLGRDEIGEKMTAARRSDVAQIQKTFDNITTYYGGMQTRHNKLLVNGDEGLLAERAAMQQQLTTYEGQMAEYAEAQDGAKKAAVLAVVQQLRKKRELSMRVLALESARTSGNMRSDKYLAEMKRIAPQIAKLSEQAVDGMSALCRSQ